MYTGDIFMTVVSVCSVLDRTWPYLRVYAICCVRKEIASRTCASAAREKRQISRVVVAAEDRIMKKIGQRELRKLSSTVIIRTR